MADNPYAGDITSSAKITQNPYAGEVTSSASIGDNGVQVDTAANPVTQGPVPSVVNTASTARSPIRGESAMLENDGPVPSTVDTASSSSSVPVPGGIYPASMRPPSTVDTSSQNR